MGAAHAPHVGLQYHFAQNPTQTTLLIMGTDCPVLARRGAFASGRPQLCSAHDACLIPAEDGGYVLTRHEENGCQKCLTNIDWSTRSRDSSKPSERLERHLALAWR